jgi:hypothetical protein
MKSLTLGYGQSFGIKTPKYSFRKRELVAIIHDSRVGRFPKLPPAFRAISGLIHSDLNSKNPKLRMLRAAPIGERMVPLVWFTVDL